MSGTTVLEVSGVAFDNAALAFTASGQSIIGEDVPPSSGTLLPAVASAGLRESSFDFDSDFTTDLEAALVLCLAQQSRECMEAQASPATTTVGELAGASLPAISTPGLSAAAALIILSQPIRQPAPAIQKATVSASVTRTILNEESDLITGSVPTQPQACRVSAAASDELYPAPWWQFVSSSAELLPFCSSSITGARFAKATCMLASVC